MMMTDALPHTSFDESTSESIAEIKLTIQEQSLIIRLATTARHSQERYSFDQGVKAR